MSRSQNLRNSLSFVFLMPLARPRACWLGDVADQVSALAVGRHEENARVGLAGQSVKEHVLLFPLLGG